MKYLAFILSLLVLQGIVSPAFAQRQRIDGDWNSPKCIEAIWKWTIPTEEEKEFDIENDLDIRGNRFSCFAEVGATEINKILTDVKKAVAEENKEKLADIAIYPFRFWIETEEPTEYGLKAPAQADNKKEFIEFYNEIVTPNFKRIIKCGSIDKMDSYSNGTVALGSAFIFFGKEPDNNKELVKNFQKYPMRIGAIGSYMPRHDDWIKEHCQ